MLSEGIAAVITEKLQDGTAERIVAEEFEKALQSTTHNLLQNYGDVGSALKAKIKSVLLPLIEDFDYREYIVKLDAVLMEVIKTCTLENRTILKNFAELFTVPTEDTINISELWKAYKDYVAENVETDGLDVLFNDKSEYESVSVNYEAEWEDRPSWSNYDRGTLRFWCEHDENLGFEIPLKRWVPKKETGWEMGVDLPIEIRSLRSLNELQVLILKLSQNGVLLIINQDSDDDEVTPNEEPEASYS